MLFKKKEKKEHKEIEKISSSQINVKVFKSLGGNIRVLKNEYVAQEKRDEFGELVSINDDTNHKEDVDFNQDSIYTEMQILLNLRSKSPEEQRTILLKKITKQEKLIYFLNKIPELNALFNFQDEWGKLRDYRILRNNLKLDKAGAYFYISHGIRTYEFDAIDGFLIPRWHGVDTYSSFPDHTRTKKIKIQADLRFQKELAGHNLNNKLINYGTIFFIINLAMLGLLIFSGFKLYEKSRDLSSDYDNAEQFCMQSTIRLNKQYSDLISDSLNLQKTILELKKENKSIISENNIKDLTPKG